MSGRLTTCPDTCPVSKARKDKAAAEAAEADAHAKELGIGKYAAAGGGGGDGLDALRGALAVCRDEPRED